MVRLLALCLALMGVAGAASAHLASDSYLRVEIGADGTVSGRWDVALRDLDVAVGLDTNADGNITWGELRAKWREIEDYAFARLTIAGAGGSCRLKPLSPMVDNHAGNAYAVLPFSADCPPASGKLTLTYRLLFEIDPTHRGLLTVVRDGSVMTDVMTPEHASIGLDMKAQSLADQALGFLTFGFDHILLGYDHLLFVAVLLVVAPLRRNAGAEGRRSWAPVAGLGGVVIETSKVLTGFTVAHATTLTLAVLGLINLPSRLVDPAVALTIMLAALDNIWPILPPLRWHVAFGFGLIHGLAFAGALGPMQLPLFRLALGLGGFNLGVELGQATLAALLVPIAFAMRYAPTYRRATMPLISLGSFALALLWFVDRVFALGLISVGG